MNLMDFGGGQSCILLAQCTDFASIVKVSVKMNEKINLNVSVLHAYLVK